MLTLRCYDSGESMAVMQMHPQQLSQVDIMNEELCIPTHETVEGYYHNTVL